MIYRIMQVLRLVFVLAVPLALSAAEHGHHLSEMDRYRQIEESPTVTCQDLVDLMLMVRGEYAKYETPEKRVAHARSEGWIRKLQAAEKLDRGHLAFALLKNFDISRGWLFRLTRLNRYALRDVQQAGVLSARYGTGNLVSGSELIGAMSAAEEYQNEKLNWAKQH